MFWWCLPLKHDSFGTLPTCTNKDRRFGTLCSYMQTRLRPLLSLLALRISMSMCWLGRFSARRRVSASGRSSPTSSPAAAPTLATTWRCGSVVGPRTPVRPTPTGIARNSEFLSPPVAPPARNRRASPAGAVLSDSPATPFGSAGPRSLQHLPRSAQLVEEPEVDGGHLHIANARTTVDSQHGLYLLGTDFLAASFQQGTQSFVHFDLAVFGRQLQNLQILLAALGSAQLLL